MLSKSKGKLIYVFDFIRIEGYIIILNLSLDVWKIIYPRARRDL